MTTRSSNNIFSEGDLVFAFAKDIDHPGVVDKVLSDYHLVFGVVMRFRRRKWDGGYIEDGENMHVNWMTISGGSKRYFDAKDTVILVDRRNSISNKRVHFDYVNNRFLHLVSSSQTQDVRGDIEKMNVEVQNLVWNNFYHQTGGGWNKKVPKSA